MKHFRLNNFLSRTLCLLVMVQSAACFKMSASDLEFLQFQTGRGHGGYSGDGGASDSDNSSTLPVGPRTVSRYMGINIGGDLQFNDITHQLNGFSAPAANLDDQGYPLPGISASAAGDFGFMFPTGDYNVSYEGDGQLTMSGAGVLTGNWQTVGDEHRNVMHFTNVPGQFGVSFTLNVTNGPGQSVRNIHIFLPGIPYGTTEIFNANLYKILKPFRQIRVMDWLGTNGSRVAGWSDVPIPAARFASGVTYEMMVTLINQTGKDLWLNIPENAANENYVKNLGTYLLTNLNFKQINALRAAQGYTAPFRIYVEYSNEVWNMGFSAYGTCLAASGNNPTRYDGAYSREFGPDWFYLNIPDGLKVAQVHADRLVFATQILKKQFAAAGMPDAIKSVLAGWSGVPAYTASSLEFVKKNYPGNPSDYVDYISIAPYFGSSGNSLSSVFKGFGDMATGSYATAVFPEFLKLAQEYNVLPTAYEGGAALGGNDGDLHSMRLAGVDKRMYQVYKDYFAVWKQFFGDSAPYNQYSLGGTPGMPEFIGQYGFWDSISSLGLNPDVCGKNLPMLVGTEDWGTVQQFCPKYQAVSEE